MELLTASEVAERLRVSKDTIRLWTQDGILPAIRINQKIVRYDFAEVVRSLRKRSERHDAGGKP